MWKIIIFVAIAMIFAAGISRGQNASPTQDSTGQLEDNVLRVTKPIQSVDRPQLGSARVRELAVTPDAKKIVIRARDRDNGKDVDRIIVVDVESGQTGPVLSVTDILAEKNIPLGMTDNNHCAVNDNDGVAQYDLTTGKVSQRYKLPAGREITGGRYSADRKRLALTTSDPGLIAIDLDSGKSTYTPLAFLPAKTRCIAFPLVGRSEFLVMSIDNEDPLQTEYATALFDPINGKSQQLTKFPGNLNVLPTADGKTAYILRQEPLESGWTSIEQWDLIAGKQMKDILLKPQSGSVGIVRLSEDGNTLFSLESMVLQVGTWDLKTGTRSAVVGPDQECFEGSFDITPDGQKLVGIVGPSVQGNLKPNKLVTYDTSALIGRKASVAGGQTSPATLDISGPLHVNRLQVSKPIQSVDGSSFGRVNELAVTPDAKKIVIHAWDQENSKDVDRVAVVDMGTGKIGPILLSSGNLGVNRFVSMTDNNHCVFLGDDGWAQYDLTTGKASRHYKLPDDKEITGTQYSADRKKLAITTADPGVIAIDLESGQSAYTALSFLPAKSHCVVYALAGRSDFLVVSFGEGDPSEAQNTVSLFDPIKGKNQPLTKFAGNLDLRLTADGKSAYIFRQEDPQETAWTGIEQWDLVAGKQVKKMLLKPQMASLGLKLSDDGNTLFMLEYIVQPVVTWDLKTGNVSGLIAPDGGGCEAFDVTPDGKKVVAIVGPWVQGTLTPKSLVTYDTSRLVSGK